VDCGHHRQGREAWRPRRAHGRGRLDPVLATSLLRPRIVEDFTHDKGLKLRVVSEQIGLVLGHIVGKLRRAFTATAKAVYEALRPRPCSIMGGLAADLLRSHAELVGENVLLRQQLVVAARRVKRPILRRHERVLITLLAPRFRDGATRCCS